MPEKKIGSQEIRLSMVIVLSLVGLAPGSHAA